MTDPRTKPEPPNPALEPVAEPVVENDYKVVGPRSVFGYPTGHTFTAALPPVQEALLIEAGHIVKQRNKKEAK